MIDLRSVREHEKQKGDKLLDKENPTIEIYTKSKEIKGRLVHKNKKGRFIPMEELEKSFNVTYVKHYLVPVIGRHYIWGLLRKYVQKICFLIF